MPVSEAQMSYAGVKVEIKRRWNYKIPWPLTRFSGPPTFLVGPSIAVETLFWACDINLILLATTVTEISSDPKYVYAPLAQIHANFGAKRCFGKLLP